MTPKRRMMTGRRMQFALGNLKPSTPLLLEKTSAQFKTSSSKPIKNGSHIIRQPLFKGITVTLKIMCSAFREATKHSASTSSPLQMGSCSSNSLPEAQTLSQRCRLLRFLRNSSEKRDKSAPSCWFLC